MKYVKLFEQYLTEKHSDELYNKEIKLDQVFPSGESTLTEETKKSLDKAVKEIKDFIKDIDNQVMNVMLVGSESRVTQKEEKFGLAKKRVEAVRKYLSKNLEAYKDKIVFKEPKYKQGNAPYKRGVDDPKADKYTKEQYVLIKLESKILEYKPIIASIIHTRDVKLVIQNPRSQRSNGDPAKLVANQIANKVPFFRKHKNKVEQYIRKNFYGAGNNPTQLQKILTSKDNEVKRDSKIVPDDLFKQYVKSQNFTEDYIKKHTA